ncbi:MAG: methyltransferase domain-containing protein [bacterium]|nr:methyltransferase domain-containing protein [bacterium]
MSKRGRVEFRLLWESPHAKHEERHHFPNLNFWRDIFPGNFGKELPGMAEGDECREAFGPGTLVPPYDENRVISVRKSQINFKPVASDPVLLLPGRFYPRGILQSAYTFPTETAPFRYLGNKGPFLVVDLNHPLAHFPLTLSARLMEHLSPRIERGGLCNDIVYTLTEEGPGLAAPPPNGETCFFESAPFERQDEFDDAEFYRSPRLVDHLDAAARQRLARIYGAILKPGMAVLDLMSSVNSHLPDNVDDLSVFGLGMNREELSRNARLSDFAVHDLNRKPKLPLENHVFDAALCSVSVEYLVDPIKVFREVARVLKPGGPFVVTFSNRWFPPKVIRLWKELHEFERVGLVLDYFKRSGRFQNLQTLSLRGYPRPETDKHFPVTELADPLFAVWGEACA